MKRLIHSTSFLGFLIQLLKEDSVTLEIFFKKLLRYYDMNVVVWILSLQTVVYYNSLVIQGSDSFFFAGKDHID